MISILLAAVAAGLAAGLLRAGIAGRPFSPPHLSGSWLALAGFLLQVAALYIRLPLEPLGERISAAALAGSLLLLLAFAWRNRQDAAFYWLGGGLLLNLAVMALNGGWMPISPRRWRKSTRLARRGCRTRQPGGDFEERGASCSGYPAGVAG